MSEHQHEEGRAPHVARNPDETAAGADLDLAATLGNAAVARLVRDGVQRAGGVGGGVLDDAVARAIEERRGGGSPLDSDAREKLEASMGEDFSDVRVHADSNADALSRSIQADAFTTGADVFFRSGKYEPLSSDGQKLLAHELTHVVQQRGAAPATELTVTDPGDASEREASDVADRVSAAGGGEVAREAEEEEELQMSVARQQEDEEELMQ
jgi:hypothetical protein